jgi:hypothetical protein
MMRMAHLGLLSLYLPIRATNDFTIHDATSFELTMPGFPGNPKMAGIVASIMNYESSSDAVTCQL